MKCEDCGGELKQMGVFSACPACATCKNRWKAE